MEEEEEPTGLLHTTKRAAKNIILLFSIHNFQNKMSSLRVASYVHVLVPSFRAYVYIHVGFMLNNVRLR